jgi:small basic protein (TIGR04137 family)
MSMDPSLKSASSLVRHRNVLTRAERMERMVEQEKWPEGRSIYGLPKVGNRKMEVGKAVKEAVEGEEAVAGAKAAPGAKGAAGAKGAPGAKGAAGAKGAPAAKGAAGAKGAPAAKGAAGKAAPAAKGAAPAAKKK